MASLEDASSQATPAADSSSEALHPTSLTQEHGGIVGALRVGSTVEVNFLASAEFDRCAGLVVSGLLAGGRQRVRLMLGNGMTKVIELRPCNLRELKFEFRVGDRVETHSLEVSSSNGLTGDVISELLPSGNHLVRLKGLDSGATREEALRPANLRLAALQVAFFPSDRLEAPRHIDPSIFDGFVCHAVEKRPAARDVKYWGGDARPWRMGVGNEPIEDAALIMEEEGFKATAEAELTAAGWDAEALHACGVRVDYLLAMTFALDLWDWRTWEVVQFLVKPATEGAGRCRFVDLAGVRPFKGPAGVFVSHCWGGKWGDLVGACVGGGRGDRVVWLDVFAVRQWPGNGADLNFRGVIIRCKALVLAAAPAPGRISAEYILIHHEIEAFKSSAEYASLVTKLPFGRLWCIGASPLMHYPPT